MIPLPPAPRRPEGVLDRNDPAWKAFSKAADAWLDALPQLFVLAKCDWCRESSGAAYKNGCCPNCGGPRYGR